jgi:dTDP-4-amino-4,6-dideoxygalactose transaminase|tara:strand:+ start:112 stop:1263 length:1152 start_codon:yes stop_codon:yes gene_type:complete
MNIPYGKQNINIKDIKHVSNSLKNNFLTGGPLVRKFEQEIKKVTKAKYVITCSSGTAALHLSLLAIKLKKNDVIIMPAINFIAVYNLAFSLGAKIFLADVDPKTGQMTPKNLIDCIKKNKLKKIKTFITMYLGGNPENAYEFFKIKKKLKCYLIEDSCHAFGSKYFYNKKLVPVGSCKHSDISTFSLHPVKSITTGEGGIVTTNNKLLYEFISLMRSHGLVKKKNKHWEYDLKVCGLNYRLSDINSALGISQIQRLKEFINHRKKISNYYKRDFLKYKDYINFPKYNSNSISSWHLLIAQINFKRLKTSKNFFLKFLKNKKIFCQYHYTPIYNFKMYYKKKLNFKGTQEYFQNTISLPIYYGLTKTNVEYVVKNIKYFINNRK